MCCTEGGCGFSPLYIQIDLTFSIVRSIQIPVPTITAIAATGDTPLIIINTDDNADTAVDGAEEDIMICLFNTLEDNSPQRLSIYLQWLKSNGSTVTVRQNTDLYEETGDRYGRASWGSTNGYGQPNPSTPVTIQFERDGIKALADEIGSSYNEVFAQIMMHEMSHPYLGNPTSHPDPKTTAYNNTVIGQSDKGTYNDLFGRNPPLYTYSVGGTQNPVLPGCLKTIFENTEHDDFYQGIEETDAAIETYPDFDLRYEGEPNFSW